MNIKLKSLGYYVYINKTFVFKNVNKEYKEEKWGRVMGKLFNSIQMRNILCFYSNIMD